MERQCKYLNDVLRRGCIYTCHPLLDVSMLNGATRDKFNAHISKFVIENGRIVTKVRIGNQLMSHRQAATRWASLYRRLTGTATPGRVTVAFMYGDKPVSNARLISILTSPYNAPRSATIHPRDPNGANIHLQFPTRPPSSPQTIFGFLTQENRV